MATDTAVDAASTALTDAGVDVAAIAGTDAAVDLGAAAGTGALTGAYQLKKIHEEIGSDVDLERFDKLFEYATSKPYGFLAIDFNPKSPDQTFRCCFNEYLA